MTLSTFADPRLAINPPTASSARMQLCAHIHKKLHAFMGATLTGLGRMDCHDDQALKSALDQLDQLLDACGGHVQDTPAITQLRACAERLACTREAEREPVAAHLYRQLALFIADHFQRFDPQPVASPRADTSVVERFIYAAFVRFDADAAARLITADFVSHPWAGLGAPAGPAGVHAIVPFFRTAFDEVSATVLDRLVDGDRVALRYVYAGRHVGDLFGIPATGRHFRIEGIAILRLEDARVAEYWREEDMLGLQRQLGVASLLAATDA